MKSGLLNVVVASFCATLAVGTASAAKFESSPPANEVAQRLQEAPKPEFVPDMTAEDQALEWLDTNEIEEGWDDQKKRYVAVGWAGFDSEDPTYDDSFLIKRSVQSMVATMDAKAQIIEFIRVEMDAIDKVVTPGTDLAAEFNEQREKLELKMNKQKEALAKLLAQVDAKEAEHLQGVTLGDRMNAAMDAAIAKLDEKYSTEEMEEEKKKKYEKAKKRYAEALEEYDKLKKEAEAHAGAITESASSKVETIAQMPLFGSVALAQFESWNEDDERYEVAIVFLWSPKMEKIVRAMIEGKNLKIPPGKMSMKDWIKSQDWSTSTGSRRFRDDQGHVHFIGIAAAAAGKSTSSIKKAKGIAQMMAQKEVVIGIFADIMAKKKAEQMMETRSGGTDKDSTVAAETFSQELQNEVTDRQVQGISRRLLKKYVHPISQQTIYVSIYGLSAAAATTAMWAEEEAYLTAMLDTKAQKASAGVKAGLESSLKKEKDDTKAYDEAKAKTEEKMEKKAKDATAPAKPKAKSGSTASAGQDESEEECPQGQTCPEKKKAQSGSAAGAGSSDASW
jgi:hypothetical protein